MAKKNYVVDGVVGYAGYNEEDSRNIVMLAISAERAKVLTEKLELNPKDYTAIPIKESEDGELSFKSTSKYEVAIKENGEESDLSIKEIGKGSTVELHVGIGESKYKGKKYQVAYLKAINIIELVPYEAFDAFADGADIARV